MKPASIRSLLALATVLLLGLVSAQDVRQYIDILTAKPETENVFLQCAHDVTGQGNWHLHTNMTKARQGAGVAGVGAYEDAFIYVFGGREDDGFRVAVRCGDGDLRLVPH